MATARTCARRRDAQSSQIHQEIPVVLDDLREYLARSS
jgi:hypothetical protein